MEPSPSQGLDALLNWGMGWVYPKPTLQEPTSPQGLGLSLLQLPGLPAPEGEAEPRAVCGTANSGMAVTPLIPHNLFPMAVTPLILHNLLHMQSMGAQSSVWW